MPTRLPWPAMREGGLFEQWRQGTFAIRSLAHLSAAVESSRSRNSRLRLATYAGSAASDAVIARRAGSRHRNRNLETLLNALDAGLWSYWARDAPEFVRTAVVATAVPTLIETGFRLGAGTDAVPVMEPARAWRPLVHPSPGPEHRPVGLDWDRAKELSIELARDALPPLVAMAVGRRLRGNRVGWGPVGWMSFAALGGYALARSRAAAQLDTERIWQARTTSAIAEARVGSRVQSALVHNSLNLADPKSLLHEMATAGSERARAALEEIRAEGPDALSQFANTGTTLLVAAEGRPIVPPEDRLRWVTNDQSAKLRDRLNEIVERIRPADGPDAPPIRVLRARGPELVLEYCGERIELTRPVPELVIRLDPTLASVALGMVWTATSALPALGGAPVWAVVPALGLQATALRRVRDRPVLASHLDRTTAALVGGAAVLLDVTVAATQTRLTSPGGLSLSPGTGATQPLALLLAAGWRHLGAERWVLAGAAAAGFGLALRVPGRRPFSSVVEQVSFVLMPAAAAGTVGSDAAREAYALDNHLDEQLAADVESAARSIAQRELDDYLHQLDVVASGLSDHRGVLTPEQAATAVDRYRREIERLRAMDPLDVINW